MARVVVVVFNYGQCVSPLSTFDRPLYTYDSTRVPFDAILGFYREGNDIEASSLFELTLNQSPLFFSGSGELFRRG